MGTLRYCLREGIHAFFRPTLATFASLSIIAAMLLLAGIIAVGMLNVKRFIDNAEERSDMVVYISDSTACDSNALRLLSLGIRTLPQVGEARYIDKATAWKRFAATSGEMLNAVDENPLPASFEITVRRGGGTATAAAAELRGELGRLGGIDTVVYSAEWMTLLERCRHYFLITAIVLAAALFLALLMTISNAVRLIVLSRRELVRALRMVGATRFAITMPFIIEGVLQGVAGGLVGAAVFYLVKNIFVWNPTLRMIPLTWGPAFMPALFILIGALFGWIGSVVAVRRLPE